MKKTLACLAVSLSLSGCMGLHGKAKTRYVQENYAAPDIVAMLPEDNRSNDLRANNTVRKVLAGVLISLGYLPMFSEAQTESLRAMGLTDGGQLKAYKPEDLSGALGADGLLYTTIENFNEINIGLYQDRKVALNMTLTDTQGSKLWEVETQASHRFVQSNILSGFAESVVLKAFKVHMLRETAKAGVEARKKIPPWPQR